MDKLSKFHLHCKHKDQILSFYKTICESEDDENRMSAARNLPCFHLLYGKKFKAPKEELETAATT